jgi:hypothetical protein
MFEGYIFVKEVKSDIEMIKFMKKSATNICVSVGTTEDKSDEDKLIWKHFEEYGTEDEKQLMWEHGDLFAVSLDNEEDAYKCYKKESV